MGLEVKYLQEGELGINKDEKGKGKEMDVNNDEERRTNKKNK